MKTMELIRYLKGLAETAEVCIDDGGRGLLPITNAHMASAQEKAEARRNANHLIVVIPAKLDWHSRKGQRRRAIPRSRNRE